MGTQTVKIEPGVNTEYTTSLLSGAYQSTNLIRFAPSGLPQKLGGWTKFYPFAIGSPVTALHAWEDLSATLHLAFGATAQLGVITSGFLDDITPQINVTNPAVSFSTNSGSNLVTIVDTGSQATTYDTVIIGTQVSVGGIVLFGSYQVTQAISANSYKITAASNATSNVTNGGAVPTFTTTSGSPIVTVVMNNHGYSVGSTFPVVVTTTVAAITLLGFYTVASVIDANTFTIVGSTQANAGATVSMNGGNANLTYYVTPGPSAAGVGYGVGGYGSGGYGDGVAPPPFTGTPITATDWTLDHFGGFLVACPDNGPIFTWNEQSGLYNAQMIANAPTINTGIFVSMSAEIIIAYGSSVLGVQDPLLINWCSAGDYTVWTASTTNLAGSFRLSRGSRIVGGLQGPQYGLIWTDLDVWSMTFLGLPNVFGFTELATGCGLASKFAAGVLGTTVYWMSYTPPSSGASPTSGAGQFYSLPGGGSVTPVPCTVWDFIFQNIDNANVSKIRCGVNSQFGEITWYFPVGGGTGVNTAYVKFTPQFNCWDIGYLGRSAWIDQSVFGPAIGADSGTNYIYQHETSNDADGQAMGEFVNSGYWAMSDGQDQMFCDLMLPDMRFGKLGGAQSASVNVSFTYADYAVGTSYTTPTYTMTSTSPPYINVRFRGRLSSINIGNSTVGSFWRLGGLRTRVAPDGRL